MKNRSSQPNGVDNGLNMSQSVPNIKINHQKQILDLYKWHGRQGGPPEGPPFFLVENSIIITFTELIYDLVLYGFVTGKTNPHEHKTNEPAIQGQVYFYKNNWVISGKCKRNFNDIYIFVLKLFYDDYRSSMLSTPSL